MSSLNNKPAAAPWHLGAAPVWSFFARFNYPVLPEIELSGWDRDFWIAEPPLTGQSIVAGDPELFRLFIKPSATDRVFPILERIGMGEAGTGLLIRHWKQAVRSPDSAMTKFEVRRTVYRLDELYLDAWDLVGWPPEHPDLPASAEIEVWWRVKQYNVLQHTEDDGHDDK